MTIKWVYSNINSKAESVIQYDEHLLSEDRKNKFYYKEALISFEDPAKETIKFIINNRKDPPKWIEFKYPIDNYRVVAYYYLGGYLVKLYSANQKLTFHYYLDWIKQFSNAPWYSKIKNTNLGSQVNAEHLFSMIEVKNIVVDMARYNKLSLFK